MTRLEKERNLRFYLEQLDIGTCKTKDVDELGVIMGEATEN